MAEPAHAANYTPSEYFALEEHANVKHEYLGGAIYAMAGGTPEHGERMSYANGALVAQLRGRPCRVYSADVRIGVLATGLVTYPDTSVACGPVERDPNDRNTITNPIVLVEILSPRTAAYDRGDKLKHYKKLPSLREVILVAHDRALIELWHRADDGTWQRSEHGAGSTLPLASIDCTLDVDDIYRDTLDQAASA